MEFLYLQLPGYSNLEIMRRIKKIFFIGFIILKTSCIEPFSPTLDNLTSSKFVVDGQISDLEGYQIVSISKTSSVNNPKKNPLSGCEVEIIDNLGNTFDLTEFNEGKYRVWIDKQYLKSGNSYQVKIITPDGIEIISEMDQMPECPPVDSVYYNRIDYPTDNPFKPRQAIQFYLDFDGGDASCRHYRWELTETWEYRATYPKSIYWNGSKIINIVPVDFSKQYCWSIEKIKNIFTLSTLNLRENKFNMFKFHLVDDQTERLTYGYSLLIEQFALSEQAYKFWNELRITSNEQGGLYNTQPMRIIGNLRSTTNPEIEILGFFNAVAIKSKRIFVEKVKDFDVFFPDCAPRKIYLGALDVGSNPLYLINVDGSLMLLPDRCVDCTTVGGSLLKPDYWPH